MRQTWKEIQQAYPDRWVVLKDMEFIKGDLLSAVVIFNCEDGWDINRFNEENASKLPRFLGSFYTGEPIEADVLSDDQINISLEPEVELEYA